MTSTKPNLTIINAIADDIEANHMRRVVHVSPTMAGGGMASVIHLLAEYPPDGWRASTCNTFSTKGVMRKLKRWRIAKRKSKMVILTLCTSIVHLIGHTKEKSQLQR